MNRGNQERHPFTYVNSREQGGIQQWTSKKKEVVGVRI